MIAAMSTSLKPACSNASVSTGRPVASKVVRVAPSKSEPSATCSMPATLTACRIARTMAVTSWPHTAPWKNACAA